MTSVEGDSVVTGATPGARVRLSFTLRLRDFVTERVSVQTIKKFTPRRGNSKESSISILQLLQQHANTASY